MEPEWLQRKIAAGRDFSEADLQALAAEVDTATGFYSQHVRMARNKSLAHTGFVDRQQVHALFTGTHQELWDCANFQITTSDRLQQLWINGEWRPRQERTSDIATLYASPHAHGFRSRVVADARKLVDLLQHSRSHALQASHQT